MRNWIQKQWVKFTCWHILLLPVSWMFGVIVSVRKYLYQKGWLRSNRLSVPVIVVGNINVGGTGKTPLVIWLAEQLKLAGLKPGIISRGYGGAVQSATEVTVVSLPQDVGDEPVLIASRTGLPVFVGANRVLAGQSLLQAYPECNVVISDDGLQHYRLQRDVEIVVVDGVTGLGNGWLLPAGPLREPKSRLKTVDVLVSNGEVHHHSLAEQNPIEMRLESTSFYQLSNSEVKADASAFLNKKTKAIAGIGNPERFFLQLRSMGLVFESKAYDDHYAYLSADFESDSLDALVMTEKDAVKCRQFSKPNFWVLPVNAVIDSSLLDIILKKLNISRK